MTTIDKAWLDERERIRAAATGGEWKHSHDCVLTVFDVGNLAKGVSISVHRICSCANDLYLGDAVQANAVHIADAHNTQGDLITEVHRLHRRLEQLESLLGRMDAALTKKGSADGV